jgi:hypothetical protein
MAKAKTTTPARSLNTIANEIYNDWRKEVSGTVLSPHAKPYLEAMYSLDKITDRYICEDGKTQVIYFLSNASTWRGPVAKRIKAELNAMLKSR